LALSGGRGGSGAGRFNVASGEALEVRQREAAPGVIRSLWELRWGLPVVSLHRSYAPDDVEGLVLEAQDGKTAALVTWAVEGGAAEIVTLDAFVEGRGLGSKALALAEGLLRPRGVRRVWLVTTNDNLRAATLYLRAGYRLVRVHLDGMEAVRRVKPGIPRTGMNGLPLSDIWEFEKFL
jgi:GNAT superfamily N-acetyltransferase